MADREFISYKVKKGDNLTGIAQALTGRASRFREIAEANGVRNPDYIRAGDVISVPKDMLREDWEERAARSVEYSNPGKAAPSSSFPSRPKPSSPASSTKPVSSSAKPSISNPSSAGGGKSSPGAAEAGGNAGDGRGVKKVPATERRKPEAMDMGGVYAGDSSSMEARKALEDIGKDALKPRRAFEKDETFVGNDNREERVYKSTKDYVENTTWVTDMLNEFAGYGNVKDIVYLEPQYRDGKRLPVISVSDGEHNYVFLVDKKKGVLYPENYAARSRYRDVMARLSERRSREYEQRERSRAMSSDRGLRLGLPSVDEVRRIAGSMPSYR